MDILTEEEFNSGFGSAYETLFSPEELWVTYWPAPQSYALPFTDKGWETALVPYNPPRFESKSREALVQSATSAGDDWTVMVNAEGTADHVKAALFSWEEEWLPVLMACHCDIALWVALFGSSLRWRVLLDPEGWAFVSGDAAFMDEFGKRAGGRGAVRRRFKRYGQKHIAPTWPDFYPVLLRSVGWNGEESAA